MQNEELFVGRSSIRLTIKHQPARTRVLVTLFSLGGEGILRTHGEAKAVARVINRAPDQGVNYGDTAPAYASSMDYYGAALGERRKEIFQASKTHIRTRDGSLKLLDDSLKRLRTDHLDLWQLHDLRSYDTSKKSSERAARSKLLSRRALKAEFVFSDSRATMILRFCWRLCRGLRSTRCWLH
ncbi:MAG: aldo/keto reductase [Planctomycetota bacterium]